MVDEKEKVTEEEAVKAHEDTGKKGEQDGENAEGIGESKATKKRSNTELDSESLDLEEAPQEVVVDEKKEIIQKGETGKRNWSLTFVSLLLVLIVVSGGVFIWARYFPSEDVKRLALSTPQGFTYELEPFFAPLNSKAESEKFLRATLVLELFDESSYEHIRKRIEGVRSNIFKILVNASPKNVENNKGKEILAEKIISTSNLLLENKIVKSVFFKNVLVI